MTISAEVICDSVSPQGKRLTTFKLRYPKFIHGEFMTHRVISRNASSSRAIPTAKLIEEVRSDALRAAPVFWGKNQSGMQAAEQLDDFTSVGGTSILPEAGQFTRRQWAKNAWGAAAYDATVWAERMVALGVHKQIVNRLLEPFSHINVVATATEWDNFFGLRLHKDAQPEMRALAAAMWGARKASKPNQLDPDQWHLPFMTRDDGWTTALVGGTALDEAIRVSVARCARVSYESFETGKRSTVEEDLKLYDRLLSAQPLHASPAEHQATPDEVKDYELTVPLELTTEQKARQEMSISLTYNMKNPHEWGNFIGWRQYRKTLKGEACAPLPDGFKSDIIRQ